MSRRQKLLLTIALVAIAIGTVAVWALPEVVRRVALDQIPKVTGRATSIEDVDLNLFTGSFALKNVRVAERQGPEALLELERIEGRMSLPWLAAFDVRLRRVAIAAPVVRIVRTGPAEFNFSDLLALIPPPDPEQKPSRWSVTIDRFELHNGRVVALDRAVSPAADWSMSDLAVDFSGVTTRAGRPPGRADLRARLGAATLRVESPAFRLAPVDVVQKVTLAGFDLARIRPYVPPEAPALPEGGTLAGALEIDWKDAASGAPRQTVSGEVAAEGLALVQRREPLRFATVGRVAARIKQADLLGRDVVLAGIDVDAPELRVVRRRDGSIDLLADVAGAAAGDPGRESTPATSQPASVAPAAADRPWRVLLERFAVERGSVLYLDETLSPAREYTLGGLTMAASGLSTSAADPPGRLAVKADVTARPGGSRPFAVAVDADALRLEPLLASGEVSVSDLDLGVLAPLLAQDFPVVPARGRLDLGLRLAAEEGADHTKQAHVSGTVRLTDAALVERAKREPFAVLPGLAVAIRQGDLLTRVLDLESVELEGVTVRAVRDEQGRIDLLALGSPRPPGPPPVASAARAPAAASPPRARRPINEAIIAATSRPWQVNLERLAVRKGSAAFQDRGVAPAQEWRLRALTVDAQRLSTAAQSPPGQLRLRGQLANGAPRRGPAALALDARSLRLAPLASSARVSLTDFALAWAAPYVPAAVAAQPTDGLLGVELSTSVAQGPAGLAQAAASGTVRLAGVAVTQRAAGEPFLKLPGVALVIKDVDAVRRAAHLTSVELDGMDVRAVRHPDGSIDLLALARLGESGAPRPAGAPGVVPPAALRPAPAPSTPPVSAPGAGPASGGASAPAAGAWTFRLDRLDLRQGTATVDDRFVRPPTALSGTDVTFTIERFTWPAMGPVAWKGSLTMPGAGRTDIEGDGTLDPAKVQIKLSTRDAPIAPYDAYFPFAARFRGLFSGDSVNEIEQSGGVWRVASRGTAWGRDIQVWGPERDVPDIRMDRMEFRGIDFSWPSYAIVDRVTFERPNVQIERDRDGVFNLRRVFEVPANGPPRGVDTASGPGEPAPASPTPARPPAPAAAPAAGDKPGSGDDGGGDLLQTIVLDFQELAIEGGSIRFLDRTTTPTFSQDMSNLELRIRDLSNVLGRQRTTLTATALVGGDAGLDIRGELSGIGETLRADLVGELRDYQLSTANPYADRATSWIVERGKLAAKIHYRVEGDAVTAEHDVKLGGLQVRRSQESDEVKNRIGLPLGLIVGLLKDTRGDIDFNLPLKASIKDRAVDWADTVWSGVKQAVLKVLVGPFRAIGRAFRGGGEDTPDTPDLSIDPVTFAAGSAVIAPEMETQITKVADFLRRSPQVEMTLRPVVTEADVESLKLQALTARIQAVQEERKLKGFGAAVAAYYKAQNLPAGDAKTPDEQLAVLRKREPAPEPRVQNLLDRRLAAARETLVKTEGIAAERLAAREPAREPATSGQGRVEFAIAGAE